MIRATRFAAAFGLALMVASPALADEATGEIGYPRGALGYDALVAGDLATAEQQLETAGGIRANDPARLLNLGYVQLRNGRTLAAQRLFEAVRDHRQHFMVELATGEAIDTRLAATRALTRITPAYAAR
jgi:Flp pilus assembly protein TadD